MLFVVDVNDEGRGGNGGVIIVGDPGRDADAYAGEDRLADRDEWRCWPPPFAAS
jgi:hypothetical protein